jgi:hypothetical protein
MNPVISKGITMLFRAMGGPGATRKGFQELGIILRDAKAGSDEAFAALQKRLADIGVTLKNKADLGIEEVQDLKAGIDEGIDYVTRMMTGGGMDAPLKKGGIVGFKKGGVVRGLDAGVHKNVRLI